MKEDFFEKIRNNMIGTMQRSLGNIRFIIGVSSQELGNYIGVSKQGIESIEQGQETMNGTQYLAISALLDMKVKESPAIKNILLQALRSPDQQYVEDNESYGDSKFSFVDKWFMTFPTKEGNELSNDENLDFYTMTMIANNYKIFINYDSLMIGRENKMFLELLQLMKESNNSLIVPLRVVDKLQSYIFSSDEEKRENAKRALTFLNTLHENDNIILKGEEGDGTIFEVVNKVFSSFKLTTKLVFITQDRELSKNLLRLNSQLKGFPIRILELKKDDKIRVYRNKSITTLVEAKFQETKLQETKEIIPYKSSDSPDEDSFYYEDEFYNDENPSSVENFEDELDEMIEGKIYRPENNDENITVKQIKDSKGSLLAGDSNLSRNDKNKTDIENWTKLN